MHAAIPFYSLQYEFALHTSFQRGFYRKNKITHISYNTKKISFGFANFKRIIHIADSPLLSYSEDMEKSEQNFLMPEMPKLPSVEELEHQAMLNDLSSFGRLQKIISKGLEDKSAL